MTSLFNQKAFLRGGLGILLVVTVGLPYAPEAEEAPQERKLMGMRTIHWYDVHWSTDQVKVNEDVEVTGKFSFFSGTAGEDAKTDVRSLLRGVGGSLFTQKDLYIDGQLVTGPMSLESGKTYDFKAVLKARRPGSSDLYTALKLGREYEIAGGGARITIMALDMEDTSDRPGDRPGGCPEGPPCDEGHEKKKKK